MIASLIAAPPVTSAGTGLLDTFRTAVASRDSGVICVSDDLFVTNAAGAKLLPRVDQSFFRRILSEARDGEHAEHSIPLAGGEWVRAAVIALSSADRRAVGVVVEITEDPQRPDADDPLAGVVGASDVWRLAVDEVRGAAVSRLATCLVGEAGTGKSTLARLGLTETIATPKSVTVVDAAEFVLSGAITHVFEALRRARSAVLVKHLEALGETHDAQLSFVLRQLRDAGVAVFATSTMNLGALQCRRIAATFEHTVHVPALRHHTSDIPGLADALLTELSGRSPRLRPDALRLLQRYRWPNNISQLRGVLHAISARSPRLYIGAEDLPGYIARHASQVTLTALEHAEADAIRSAMRVANGNKSAAADLVGISRSTFYRKLRRYDILGMQDGSITKGSH